MNLNCQATYTKIDQHNTAKSIALLPDQIREIIEEARLIKVPKEYSQINKVVLAGMGGSNLGIRLIRQAFSDQIRVPINIQAGYGVPNYVDKQTLYIISSYSGNTEEPLSTYREAKKRGAKIIAITKNETHNKLRRLILRDDIPAYLFVADKNPSNQPRLGLGYSVFGIAVLLAKVGILQIKVKEINKIIDLLEINSRKLGIRSPSSRNMAKKIAKNLMNKMPILVGAEFLTANLHVLRNQLNENAKTFASYLILPDLNHYALEGLQYPATNQQNLVFVIFNSRFYKKRVQKRLALTAQVIKKNKIKVIEINLQATNKKAQIFELLQLGSWLSYYLGILYEVDPANIPWVNWFKEKLA